MEVETPATFLSVDGEQMSVSPATTSAADEMAARESQRRRVASSAHEVFLFLSVVVLIASLLLDVNSGERVTLPFTSIALPSVCQFRNTTGLDCPGCGLSRSFIHIAHGDVMGALKYNPASLLVFAFVLAQVPYRSVQIWRIRRGLSELRWPLVANISLAVVVAALILQWAVRMIWALMQ